MPEVLLPWLGGLTATKKTRSITLRVHGTTRERPLARFGESERHLLQPLPSIAPESAVWARLKLATTCHVQFEQCRYSAPYLLIGERLWLRATSSAVQINREHEMVATHPRLTRPGHDRRWRTT